MEKTKRGFVTAGVLMLAFLILYPIERETYDAKPLELTTDTSTRVTGHDWIWDVEAVAFDYMALEVAIVGVVLYAIYWFISG